MRPSSTTDGAGIGGGDRPYELSPAGQGSARLVRSKPSLSTSSLVPTTTTAHQTQPPNSLRGQTPAARQSPAQRWSCTVSMLTWRR